MLIFLVICGMKIVFRVFSGNFTRILILLQDFIDFFLFFRKFSYFLRLRQIYSFPYVCTSEIDYNFVITSIFKSYSSILRDFHRFIMHILMQFS